MNTRPQTGYRIAIVDDNPKNVQVIGTLLREKGFLISIAENGKRALKIIEANLPDLILLDIIMPVMDGIETCRRLKKNPATRGIPVIFMSALTETGDKIKGFSAGAVDYVTKPVKAEELTARINTHLTIRKLQEKLEDANAELEEKVGVRTRDITAKNIALQGEVERRKQAEKALKRSERELTIRNDIANIFLTIPDRDMYGEALRIILRETESEYGVFGYIDEKGDLVCPSIAGNIRGERPDPDKDTVFARETWGGVWGGALIEKKPMYSNEFPRAPDKLIPMRRVLAMPLINHGDAIGLLLVANKAINYDEKDIELLASISEYIAPVLAARLQRDQQENDRKETERENAILEKRLRQAQKMEAIGTLAGGIAHDFNNILYPIICYTEMIMEDLSEDGSQREYLKEILFGAQRASELVKQILAFSRQADQQLIPLKVQWIIKEALKLIRATLPTTIEIRQNLDNNCHPVVADPTHMHQIIMNLCTNAYHAMENNGGKLEIGLMEVDLSPGQVKDLSLSPGPYVRFTVSDTGVGMSKSVKERIFDPYFTTKEKEKGTGLGLSVAHGIVKSYGGDIGVWSEPGEGAVFDVYLPRTESRIDGNETEDAAPLPRGNERILLVDDEEPIILLGKTMLERLGYEVTVHTSGTEALEAFKAQPDKYDLVISDMTMPNMTGDELSRKLIEFRPDIPIILCTGYSTTITADKAKALGIKKFIKKPIISKKMAKAVRDVLDG